MQIWSYYVQAVSATLLLHLLLLVFVKSVIQGGSNMTGTDLYVNKPHYAAAV